MTHVERPGHPVRTNDRIPVLLLKLVVSYIIALPASGAVYAIVGLVKLAITSPSSLKNVSADVVLVIFWTIAVPVCGGMVPQNEGDVGPRINMYAWILPTMATIFFVLSRGWRWFKR
jgi:hypothetical protein